MKGTIPTSLHSTRCRINLAARHYIIHLKKFSEESEISYIPWDTYQLNNMSSFILTFVIGLYFITAIRK